MFDEAFIPFHPYYTQWDYTYLESLGDGTFLALGKDNVSNTKGSFIMRFNLSGTVLWAKSYTQPGGDLHLHRPKILANGNIGLCGRSNASFFLELDISGNTQGLVSFAADRNITAFVQVPGQGMLFTGSKSGRALVVMADAQYNSACSGTSGSGAGSPVQIVMTEAFVSGPALSTHSQVIDETPYGIQILNFNAITRSRSRQTASLFL